ncbi:MAG TPA: dihydrodipicolinate synthase family protein [Burkholderiales bacterium]|nr:dihydrodipicolinate synthase family protein [Burkholderiales bacterium]
MTQAPRIRGVLSPVVTPFRKDLSPDPERLIAQCKWLLTQNCGLAVFGTNSEANSLSVNERIALLDALLAADVDPARMMPGTGCCALTDTVRLTEHAVKAGCAGVLMLPPFYYKDVSEDGLYRSFSEVIERVGDSRLRVYLYHIPPIAVVGIKPGLVERLMKQYPTAIAGMKDSSGDWNNTKMMLDAFARSGFDVFAGSESFLLANMKNGGAGCISATANVNPAAIDRLYGEWRGPNAEVQQQALDVVRKTVGQYVMIPALKAVIAHYTNEPEWATVRPPLTELTAAQAKNVIDGLKKLDFDMPGIGRAQAKAA